MRTRIYAMNTDGKDYTDECYAPYLTRSRKDESLKRQKPRDRQLYLAAEVLLNRALELSDAGMAIPAVYSRNAYGKPYLPLHTGIHINWSHSGTWVICVLSDREVGIDLQMTGQEPKDAVVRRGGAVFLQTGAGTAEERAFLSILDNKGKFSESSRYRFSYAAGYLLCMYERSSSRNCTAVRRGSVCLSTAGICGCGLYSGAVFKGKQACPCRRGQGRISVTYPGRESCADKDRCLLYRIRKEHVKE